MNLEKQFAESMAHFVSVKEWEGYKRGVQDVCSVAQPLLDDMLDALKWCVQALEYDYRGTSPDCEIPQDIRDVITKATGDPNE